MPRKNRVLIIEDEKQIARYLELELQHEGYVVDISFNGKDGLEFFKRFDADIVLLDLMLPGLNGFEVLNEIKSISNVPVIMLTARDDTSDKVKGLDLGADDYVTKPFQIEELLARMRSKLSKKSLDVSPKRAVVGDLVMDFGMRELSYKGEGIELTKREYDLLKYLLEHKNTAIAREQLMREVWGYDYIGETNVVDVYIRYLRQKIDDVYGIKLIHTLRGVGYIVKDD